ncbi:YlaC family protein [Yersinia ruckeri]|uniref:YlaC family protein n=1 Tax=Yersinia ruckeri TaxID=29486 RepID=UPI000BDE840E|nr:YlaC family protein [Yersinia ruckeri]MCK8538013.1 YlaC family protein [Yersinia ruckeri]MCK8569760.1 YlaC family protein [Yersinia ruckeri]MCK8579166.1 YlaC family protein [Yersinia ruckeri]MCK8580348.1 YlaC family protein [Yersinia ruckeri]UZX50851.1 YlaC family protein [Yersinia ruckeri]
MDIVKEILIEDIEKINKKEKRNGRLNFNIEFIHKHPYLCLAMLISYFFVLVLMVLTPYFGTYYVIGFTVFFVFMSAILLMEIKPVFKFEDIGVLDLRVCYNGEWFFSRAVSMEAVDKLLNNSNINDDFKNRIKRIIENKGEIDFYDVYDLAYSKKPISPLNGSNIVAV